MRTSSLLFAHLFTMALALTPQSSQGKSVLVAVIDTGADVSHSFLKKSLWRNPGETGFDDSGHNKSNNGIDDDGNGFIDDVQGWNFVDNNKDLTDDIGHGTHVAGIISQNPEAQIMVLKAMASASSNGLNPTIAAIEYAIANKAQIINYSGGGLQASADEKRALQKAEKAHILVVAAAGNEKANADRHGFFPAAYELSNILSVAAVDIQGRLLPSSNYGKKSVHLAAPGFRVLSSLPGDKFGLMTGTSQATAVASMAASLLCSRSLACSPVLLIQNLIHEGDHSLSLDGKLQNPVVVNSMRAAQDVLGASAD